MFRKKQMTIAKNRCSMWRCFWGAPIGLSRRGVTPKKPEFCKGRAFNGLWRLQFPPLAYRERVADFPFPLHLSSYAYTAVMMALKRPGSIAGRSHEKTLLLTDTYIEKTFEIKVCSRLFRLLTGLHYLLSH
jgi:hypothetical protein